MAGWGPYGFDQRIARFGAIRTVLWDNGTIFMGADTALGPHDQPHNMNVDSLKQFHCFGKLAIELRIRIYSLIEPDPVLISPCAPEGLYKRWSSENSLSPNVPVVLQICRESRYEFLATETPTRNHRTYKLVSTLLHQDLCASYDQPYQLFMQEPCAAYM